MINKIIPPHLFATYKTDANNDFGIMVFYAQQCIDHYTNLKRFDLADEIVQLLAFCQFNEEQEMAKLRLNDFIDAFKNYRVLH